MAQGGSVLSDLETALEDLNAAYSVGNMVFYQCADINYINETDNMSLTYRNSEIDNLVDNNNVDNVINIYFTETVFYGGSDACGYATFPSDYPDENEIIIANNCATNTSTLAHEMGHYFSLYHTHETFLGG